MRNDQAQTPDALPRRRRPTWLRRVLGPLVVLIAAGWVYMYTQQQREQQAKEVLLAAEQLCEQVAQMPQGGAMPPRALQLQASLTTIEQLQSVLDADKELQTLSITVVQGDADPPYGDGSATHQAMVSVQGHPGIALRFLHTGDAQQLRLIGFWMPSHS